MTNTTPPIRGTARRALQAIRAVLPPAAELEIAPGSGGSGADVVIVGQPFRVEWIGEGSLGRVNSLLDRLDQRPAIVVARRLSPGACDALSKSGVGWVDETGAAEVVGDSFLVSRTGWLAEPQRTRRWNRSVLAVAEALLCGVTPTVSATAAATGLSVGSCTNALRFLAGQKLLEAAAERGRYSARSVSDADRLLETYARAADDQVAATAGPSLAVGMLARDPLGEFAEIGRQWSRSDISWAATGPAAASVLAPLLTNVNTIAVYVDATTYPGLEAVAREAELQPFEGGRLTLRPFPTVTCERMTTTVDNLRVVPWPRVFVDLRRAGVRGEEAAEHLRERVAA